MIFQVNNLVCDIKDAGATISDILDEMQALKMFLNEEESTPTSSTNRNSAYLNDSSLLMATNESLFPWQRSPINASWDFQDGNARSSLLTNVADEQKGSDKEG